MKKGVVHTQPKQLSVILEVEEIDDGFFEESMRGPSLLVK